MDYLYNFGNHVFDSIKFSKLSFKNDNKTPTVDISGAEGAEEATLVGNNTCGSVVITFSEDPSDPILCDIVFSGTLEKDPIIFITSTTNSPIYFFVSQSSRTEFQISMEGTFTGVEEISFNYLVIS